jgi:hypothetical protein
MFDRKLTIDLSGVGNDIPTRLGKIRPTLTHVEKVTKQARIIYDIKEDRTYILHCFTSHKEYEHWYSSYK